MAQLCPRKAGRRAPTSLLIRPKSGWGDESSQQDEKQDGFEDEDEGACVPAGIEGEERAQAVVVGPVQQEVAEKGDEGEAVEQTPADGGAGWLAGGFCCAVRQR